MPLLILIGTIVLTIVAFKLLPIDRYAALTRSLAGPLPSNGTVAYTHPGKTSMTISSPAFSGGRSIPSAYTCDGTGMSPPLSFTDVPTSTKSLALIVHDPDAMSGDFTHWTVWNIAPETREIAEGTEPTGVVQGTTSAGRAGYVSPCPPNGTHRYTFELYALDEMLDLKTSASRQDLETAMQDHVIDTAELVGTYKRTR